MKLANPFDDGCPKGFSFTSMKRLLTIFILLGSFVHALFSERISEMPNLIILLADDLGYGELGCQGNPEIPTPHIDGIAKRGIRFTQGYVTAPNCSPSRAGLITELALVMNSTQPEPRTRNRDMVFRCPRKPLPTRSPWLDT